MYNIVKPSIFNKNIYLLCMDFCIILLCFILAGAIRHLLIGHFNYWDYVFPNKIFATCIILFVLAYQNNYSLYLSNQKQKNIIFFFNIIRPIILGYLVLMIAYYLLPQFFIGRGVLVIEFLLLASILYAWRLTYSYFFKSQIFSKKCIILGKTDLAQRISDELTKNYYGYSSVQIVEADIATIQSIVKQNNIEEIIVATLEPHFEMDFFWQCHLLKCKIVDGISLHEFLTGQICDERLKAQNVFFTYNSTHFQIIMVIKRLVDIILSSFLLLATLPLQLITAVFVKVVSSGPIIYAQKRIGMHEKEFTMYKFRTMYVNAENQGTQQTTERDKRIFRGGQFMRRLRLDELPQLINVIKGDMSLIGPRPEVFYFTEQFRKKMPWYFLRHSVRPGITGWAQVQYKYAFTFEEHYEKLKYDLYYIKHISLALDFLIALKTVKVVLTGSGK